MLNVKQGSCEYQVLKSFGLTRPGNQTPGLPTTRRTEEMEHWSTLVWDTSKYYTFNINTCILEIFSCDIGKTSIELCLELWQCDTMIYSKLIRFTENSCYDLYIKISIVSPLKHLSDLSVIESSSHLSRH